MARGHTREWLFENLVWSDLCNSVLPRTEKVAQAQALARKRKHGWGSKRTRRFSRNLRGSQEVMKQKGWGSERIWWVPILARGKLHVEVLAPDFPGEEPAGAPAFLAVVRKGVAIRFQSQSKPTTLFLDRGRAFFNPVSAKITPELASALEGAGLETFWRGDASMQPGYCADILLHETAVSWIRQQLSCTVPKAPWQETRADYGARLRRAVAEINRNHNTTGLCDRLLSRMAELKRLDGDRLAH